MDAKNDHPPLEPRLPTTDELLLLCRRLNEASAEYLVLGGFAMIQHGFARATEDILGCFGGPNRPAVRGTPWTARFWPGCSRNAASGRGPRRRAVVP